MRKLKSLMLATGLVMTASSAMAGNDVYKVELNKTEIVKLPSAASSIIVGNPKIADVTVHSVDTIFVVGRGYGETNLIVLDAQGQTMMNTNLQVVNTLSNHGVRLYNARDRETYSCIPYCGPSPVLGDTPAFIAGNTSSEREIEGTIAGATTSQNATPGNDGNLTSESPAGGAPFASPPTTPF